MVNNRLRLLYAAADTFSEHGFEGTSLRTIAEAAKASFQLITYYFGSKEALWTATVDYLFERYLETGKGLRFTVSGNLHEQFRNHLRLLLTDRIQRPQLHKICVQEQLANGPRYRNSIAPKLAHVHLNLALPYFRETVRLGIVKKFTAEEACLIWSAVARINIVSTDLTENMLSLPANSPKTVERQVDLMFGIITEVRSNTTSSPAPHAEVAAGREPKAKSDKPISGAAIYQLRGPANRPPAPNRAQELEAENRRLKESVGELELEKQLLIRRVASLTEHA